jgi:hypothetical protein
MNKYELNNKLIEIVESECKHSINCQLKMLINLVTYIHSNSKNSYKIYLYRLKDSNELQFFIDLYHIDNIIKLKEWNIIYHGDDNYTLTEIIK